MSIFLIIHVHIPRWLLATNMCMIVPWLNPKCCCLNFCPNMPKRGRSWYQLGNHEVLLPYEALATYVYILYTYVHLLFFMIYPHISCAIYYRENFEEIISHASLQHCDETKKWNAHKDSTYNYLIKTILVYARLEKTPNIYLVLI